MASQVLAQAADFLFSALMAWSGLDPAVAQLQAIPAMKEIQDKYKNLAKQIAEDDVMYNQLYAAISDKNSQWAADLINSSPFGTRARAIRQEISNGKRQMEQAKSKLKANAKKASDLVYDYQKDMLDAAGTGSALIDAGKKLAEEAPNVAEVINKTKDAGKKAIKTVDKVIGGIKDGYIATPPGVDPDTARDMFNKTFKRSQSPSTETSTNQVQQ